MGVCSSFIVEEWKEALEPYELNDSLLSEVYMAAAHGAVEVLAEQWKIRNIAYANLLKNRSFPDATTQTATAVSFQSARGSPHGWLMVYENLVGSLHEVQPVCLTMYKLM